jgi:hypothetical protein
MGEKRALIIVLALILLVCLGPAASAVAIGVSPSSLNFQIRAGTSEDKAFQVSSNSQTGLPFRLAASESMKDLILFEPAEGIVNVSQAARIRVSASAPDGAIPGNYTGFIIVTAAPQGADSSGSSVSTGVALRINVEILNGNAFPDEAAQADPAGPAGSDKPSDSGEIAAPKRDASAENPRQNQSGMQDKARLGNEITGNAAAAEDSASSTSIVLVAVLVSIAAVIFWAIFLMRPNGAKKESGKKMKGYGRKAGGTR